MKPEHLLEAYRLAARGAGPHSPLVARYRTLAAELGIEPDPTTGEPDSAVGTPSRESRPGAESSKPARSFAAHFR